MDKVFRFLILLEVDKFSKIPLILLFKLMNLKLNYLNNY